MANGSAIEWTDNAVPVVTGCTNKGAGCKHCYAIPLAWRLAHHPHPALAARYAGTVEQRPDGTLIWTGRVNLNLDQLDAIQRARRPQTWFVSHMGALFHDAVPAAVVDAVLAVAALKPEQRLILLTKRPERAAQLLAGPQARHNVWVGASVAHDRDAAEAAPHLRALHQAGWRTMVSYEPALGAVDWDAHGLAFLDWLISGGESGPDARPTHPDWHRAALSFCRAYGVAYYFKQWGAWAPFYDRDRDDPDWRRCPQVDGQMGRGAKRYLNLAGGMGFHGERLVAVHHVGRKAAGHLLDGRAWQQVPWAESAS